MGSADRQKRNRRGRGEGAEKGPFSRSFLRIQDLTLALAVIVVCAGVFFFRRAKAPAGAFARVYLDGEEVRVIVLAEEEGATISLREEYGVPVAFQVRDGAVCFVDVECPDHICEKTGYISRDGQTAVCMPNKVALHVVER